MYQLVQLRERYAEFSAREAEVVAVTQEDDSEDMTWSLLDALDGDVPFELVADHGRQSTERWERVTTYLLGPERRVLEIFPAHRDMWFPWDAVLNRIDDLAAELR